MHRLLYISTARAPLTPSELDDVLHVSRRNNAAAGITGLLIVGGRRFLQVLEGPEKAVGLAFIRIAADPRHFAVVSLAREPITARTFAEWSMGCLNGGNADGVNTPANAVAQILTPINDSTLRAYFSGFIETHAAA